MSNSLSITAKFLGAGKEKQITDTFRKREFWIDLTENPEYPSTPQFELVQDKCALLDGIKPGDTITVHFNIEGRKYPKVPVEGQPQKVFTSLKAWKIDTAAPVAQPVTQQTAAVTPTVIDGNNDDLPF